jgi:K+-sensing histidine kinase KdpD
MARLILRSAHPVIRYTFAVFVAALVAGATAPLAPLLWHRPSPPFLLAVLVVAWVAGFGPAMVTCGLSIFAINYFFIPPLYSLTWQDLRDPGELVGVPIFTAVAVIMAWLATSRRQAESERIAYRPASTRRGHRPSS